MKVRSILAVLAASIASVCSAQIPTGIDLGACGSLDNHYGPFDFRTASRQQIELVESNHLGKGVQSFDVSDRSGRTWEAVGADLSYTLRVFPNHPRALDLMSRLAVRHNKPQPPGAQYSMECYFERAARFAETDPTPLLLQGVHLARLKQPREAIKPLTRASALAPRDANIAYNLGLAYLDSGDTSNALEQAKIAYSLGFPLPGLRKRLMDAGVWKEP